MIKKLKPPSKDIIKHLHGIEDGKVALLVLGGTSGAMWEQIRDEIKPDIIIGVNAVKKVIRDLDYWVCHENMTKYFRMASRKDPEGVMHMEGFRVVGPKISLVNYKSLEYLKDTHNAFPIESCGVKWGFNTREYGNGLLCGKPLRGPGHKVQVAVGTGASRALHFAGILGVSEVHTIGLDLCIKNGTSHHWYEQPLYRLGKDGFWNKEIFVTYKGLRTNWIWVETAEFLHHINRAYFARQGMKWVDHSEGLLKVFDGIEKAEHDPAYN